MTVGSTLRALVGTVLAVALFSITDVQAVLGQLPQAPSVPALPKAPSLQPPVQLPKVPSAPAPQAPSVQVPSVPGAQAPSVRTPAAQAPAPSAPSVPSTPSGPIPPGQAPSAAGGLSPRTGAGESGSASAGPGASNRAAGARGRASASRRRTRADVPPRTRPERRLRNTVVQLWACSYAVTGTQRRVLALRAGLDGHPATSRAGTARILGLSGARVRRAQRAGLHRLRQANRSDGCAMGAVSPAMARQGRAMIAVATAPRLVRLAAVGVSGPGRGPGHGGQLASNGHDRGAVLGERASAGGRKGASSERHGARAASAASTVSSDGSAPWIVMMGLLFLGTLVLALLVLRRPGMAPTAVPTATRSEPPEAPVPSPDRPATNGRWNENFWQPLVGETPPRPAAPARLEAAKATALAPLERSGSETSGASGESDARRMAGVAASGAASLLLGVALRARRRR